MAYLSCAGAEYVKKASPSLLVPRLEAPPHLKPLKLAQK